LALLFFTAAVALLGHRVSDFFWSVRAAAPLSREERITSSATVSMAIALALTWALAIAGELKFWWLLGTAAALLIAALLLPRRSAPAEEARPEERNDERNGMLNATIIGAVFVPMLAWTAFLLWRGYVTPPLSHDALVYHLPRAAMFTKTAHFQDFHFPDDRVDALPANYELLLADILILGYDDTVTEWLSTIQFILFLIAAAALAKRWWGGGRHLYVVTLILCTAPVLLLQGAAIKNDLMVALFAVVALLFTGRWLTSRELPAAVLAIVALIAGIGTKPTGAMIALCLAPLLVIGAVRAMREKRFGRREIAVIAIVALAAVALLGGFYYLHVMFRGNDRTAQQATTFVVQSGYGEWSYLWQVPIVMWLAPFSNDPFSAPVPWSGQTWWWPRWDVHDSNFGALLSLLVLALPWVMWKWRGDRERTAIVIAAFAAIIVALPRRVAIYGAVSGYPRYFLFLAVVIVCAVVPPLYQLVERSRRAVVMQVLVIASCAALFVNTARDVAFQDSYTPLARVLIAAAHPGHRGVPIYRPRGGTVLDAIAGPADSVDMYCGWDAWTYPAMGRTLQRDLHFIGGVSEIRPQVQWVVVDGKRNWGDPNFADIADWRRYMGHAKPRPADLAVIQALRRDPRFEPVYVDMSSVEALFRRRTAGTRPLR